MKISRPVLVLLATAAAVVVNLAIYLIGGAAGASYQFPDGGSVIPWFVVVLFSAVPLGLALTAVALLAPRWPWISRAALIAAPVLALVSIPLMPVPVGFDLGTTVGLSLMHVTVGLFGFLAVWGMRSRLGQSASRSTIGSSASA